MDGFTYTNIFATKGIEYIAILSFFALLIPFWFMLSKQVKVNREIKRTLGLLTAANLRLPKGLLFSKYHSWTHLDQSGLANVGIDDFLVRITGDINLSHIKKAGEKVSQGDLLMTIEVEGKTLDILSPVSGEIISANQMLLQQPELLFSDPYTTGWVYRIQPVNWMAETSSLILGSDAAPWYTLELERFRDFLGKSAVKHAPGITQAVLQDGGELMEHAMAMMPKEIWADFQSEFLGNARG
ncbi:MAG TPA: hypothetical protein DCY35_02935 [Prolixibacteraceae bacterium]|nr:hypothetical protein [Prolixibacteraceae bacterium]